MNPRLSKIIVAARQQPDATPLPKLAPGSGQRIYQIALGNSGKSDIWLRGMVWGTACCAAVAIATTAIPAPTHESPAPELFALSGAATYIEESETQP